MFSQLFAASCLFVVGFAFTTHDCPSILPRNRFLKVHGNKCYRFLANQKREFEDAEDYCRYYNGQLAMVKTAGINNFIRNTIKHYNHFHAKVWLGLRYDYNDGVFKWEDGTAVDYDNFDDKETFFDDCAYMQVHTGTWFNHDCGTAYQQYAKHYFVCEYAITTPTPKPTPSVDHCPLGLVRDKNLQVHGHLCYRFVVDESHFKNFRGAQGDCKKHGGHLAVVRSRHVNQFIAKHLNDDTYDETWIGLRYHPNTDLYQWVDGTHSKYDNFDINEANAEGNCVSMDSEGFWFSQFCDDHHYYNNRLGYVCQYHLTKHKARVTAVPHSTAVLTSTTPEIATTETEATTKTPEFTTMSNDEDTTTKTPEFTTMSNDEDTTTKTPEFTTMSNDEDTTTKTPEFTTMSNNEDTTTKTPEFTTMSNNEDATTKTPEFTTMSNDEDTTTKTPEFTTMSNNEDTTTKTPEFTTMSNNEDTTTKTPEFTTMSNNEDTTTKTPEFTTMSNDEDTTTKTPEFTTMSNNEDTTTKTPEFTTMSNNEDTTTKTPEFTTVSNADKETTIKPQEMTTPTATVPTPSKVRPTCPTIVCLLDCGLDGYVGNAATGCIECRCND